MHSKILILKFSKTVVEKPIVCNLVKNHDLTFNILNAAILPQREGVMVLELTGPKKNFSEGIQYLKDMGVQVQNASQEVKRDNKTMHPLRSMYGRMPYRCAIGGAAGNES